MSAPLDDDLAGCPPDRVPQATYDAVRYVLYFEGLNREDWLYARLLRMSPEQLTALLAWIDQRNANFLKDRSGQPIASTIRALVARCQR